MKKIIVAYSFILLLVLVLLVVSVFYPNYLEINFTLLIQLLTLVVSVITGMALLLYVFDTNRIANQTIDSNLRPVMLRSGFINLWEDIKFKYDKDEAIKDGKLLQFSIWKNIAKDIKGYIILDGYKYDLLFGNDISKVGEKDIKLTQKWGWMKPESVIYAAHAKKGKKTTLKNQIYVEYKDIENNEYYTTEDENFSQESFKKVKFL